MSYSWDWSWSFATNAVGLGLQTLKRSVCSANVHQEQRVAVSSTKKWKLMEKPTQLNMLNCTRILYKCSYSYTYCA